MTRLTPIVRTLLLSKFDALCRRITSSMRGCCHRPGVEVADNEGVCCCWGDIWGVALLISVDTCRGVRLSFGRVIGDVVAGVAGF